jgi:hypothetical protein
MVDSPSYPYGTRITLEDGVAEKFDCLDGCTVGETVLVTARAKIVSVRQSEMMHSGKPGKSFNVELQLTDMAMKPDDAGDMQEGFEKATNDED